MNFRTIVELPKYEFNISHNHKCIFIGSCFSENIGEKLVNSKISTLVNSTGIHYNPYSIYTTLKIIIEASTIVSEDLFFSNGVWNNYMFHSKFSGISRDDVLKKMNNSILISNKFLKSCDYLFVTFGTSYVYSLKDNGNIVSNCHKQPSNIFERKFLCPQNIKNLWIGLIKELNLLNPKLKIIFTVSPIRHWKDGAINNAYSKASLINAIQELLEDNNITNLYYFPAFEIVNDELRDYRFYADDMLHPSSSAIEYIWERFADAFFSHETVELNKRIKKIIQASQHRPFNKDTKEYISFCEKMLDEITMIENSYPFINMNNEKSNFIMNKSD